METVDELYPQAQAFVNTIAELLRVWFEEQFPNQQIVAWTALFLEQLSNHLGGGKKRTQINDS